MYGISCGRASVGSAGLASGMSAKTKLLVPDGLRSAVSTVSWFVVQASLSVGVPAETASRPQAALTHRGRRAWRPTAGYITAPYCCVGEAGGAHGDALRLVWAHRHYLQRQFKAEVHFSYIQAYYSLVVPLALRPPARSTPFSPPTVPARPCLRPCRSLVHR